MESSTARPQESKTGREQPSQYLEGSDSSARRDTNDKLQEQTTIHSRRSQLSPRPQRTVNGDHPLTSRLETELQSSRAYRRASAVGHDEISTSSQRNRQRRKSHVDVSDPNFCNPQDGDDPRIAMLREFAKSKLYVDNDFWGRETCVLDEEEVREPPKLVRWLKGKVSSHHFKGTEMRGEAGECGNFQRRTSESGDIQEK
ncbi:uncharacterized protein PV09_04658 [Verruconis gallopava]|uniref:Uncharacterized protein n=1 Tax=Verruconis gallopava TaxID=253628 RepID=A0A0D2AYY5_9PEZI|nr:uncharacterized protein PV09_04658 [Verruconis gallopava]KIW04374.1 hypothetical protein PV09_04658 [Verruconis gallopava]